MCVRHFRFVLPVPHDEGADLVRDEQTDAAPLFRTCKENDDQQIDNVVMGENAETHSSFSNGLRKPRGDPKD